MIEVFKIAREGYDSKYVPNLQLVQNCITRGNSLKLMVEHCAYDLRKYNFCNRVINV